MQSSGSWLFLGLVISYRKSYCVPAGQSDRQVLPRPCQLGEGTMEAVGILGGNFAGLRNRAPEKGSDLSGHSQLPCFSPVFSLDALLPRAPGTAAVLSGSGGCRHVSLRTYVM